MYGVVMIMESWDLEMIWVEWRLNKIKISLERKF